MIKAITTLLCIGSLFLACGTDLTDDGDSGRAKNDEEESSGIGASSADALADDSGSTESKEPEKVGESSKRKESPDESGKVKNIILIPGAVTAAFLAPATIRPLQTLKKNLEQAGYDEVVIAEYKNILSTGRADMEASLIDAMQNIMKSGKTYHVIGHSMGHYVGMVAVVKGGFSKQVGSLIGLAGAAGGGDKAPIGCGSGILGFGGDVSFEKCPAMEGLLQGRDDFIIDNFKKEHAAALADLKKCSIAVKNDRFLTPADSGFFEDGENSFVTFARHENLPSDPKTVGTLQKKCGI